MKIKLIQHITLLLAFTIYGCTYEVIEPEVSAGFTTDVCFEADILPIFQTNCTVSKCHNADDKRHGYDLSTYEGIMKGIYPGNYARSQVYGTLIKKGDNIMPPPPYSPLDQSSIALIAKWIEEGAKYTIACDTLINSNCALDGVTYSGTVAPLMQKYCNGCHSGSAPSANLATNTYLAVKTLSANPAYMGSMQHRAAYSPMPKNGAKLSSCQLDQIQKWIELGAKND